MTKKGRSTSIRIQADQLEGGKNVHHPRRWENFQMRRSKYEVRGKQKNDSPGFSENLSLDSSFLICNNSIGIYPQHNKFGFLGDCCNHPSNLKMAGYTSESAP